MLKEIKEEMLKNTDSIIELLEYFDFAHIHQNDKEIRFARDNDGGQNIRIRLDHNEYLCVVDFVRSERLDIFSYIIKEKNVSFPEVIQKTKEILGLDANWMPKKKLGFFNNIYDKIGKTNNIELKTYDISILNQYENIGNERFLKDGISLYSQEFFNIRFSNIDNRIIIPIKNEWGELVGVKGRYNGDPDEFCPKYIYPIPVMASQVLYGYSENYQFLYGADRIYIGESEKFVMQCHTMGIRNCVSLGSHTLSIKQSQLLIQLQPIEIVFMLDEGLPLEETIKNAKTFKSVEGLFNISIKFFDYRDCLDIGEKDSPSDNGIDVWNDIIENYLKDINEIMDGD